MMLQASFLFAAIAAILPLSVAQRGSGSTTRGWSCCKNTCSWPGKASVNQPVLVCDANDNLLDNYNRRDGCESGGGSFACSDLSPWAVSNDLAYGFAAVNLANSNESAWCCSCYQLTFTSGSVNGKKMVVQVTDTGSDLGQDQFNIAIPGGGEGSTGGCTKEYGTDVWGQDFGGVAHREDCDALPAALQGGCYWRFDWFRAADNPTVSWEKVVCPEALSSVSGCRRNDDPVGGFKPSPSPTTSAPISSGTVQPGGQCGGRNYKGPTRCVGGTVCTYVDENSYYCLADPASTRTTVTTTTIPPSAAPTVGLPYDRCGGNGWTGPTTCKDSVCVRVDEWYSQCQPTQAPPANPPRTSSTQGTGPNRPTRSRRPVPASSNPGVSSNTLRTTSTTRSAAPVPTGPAQLYDQCGGLTWQGTKQCTNGLVCVKVDDYYSQCQRPA